jgi:hypothetical protein
MTVVCLVALEGVPEAGVVLTITAGILIVSSVATALDIAGKDNNNSNRQ